MKKFGILFIVLVGIATTSFGQTSSQATAQSSATIVGALTLTNTADLKFGQMTAPTALGGEIVVVDASDGISAGGNITLIGGSPVSSAAYEVAGTEGATYAITLPADGSVTLTNGANSMDVDTFTSSKAGNVSTLGAAVGGVNDTFKVGASLHVATAQAAGVYTGSFDVTVAYN